MHSDNIDTVTRWCCGEYYKIPISQLVMSIAGVTYLNGRVLFGEYVVKDIDGLFKTYTADDFITLYKPVKSII